SKDSSPTRWTRSSPSWTPAWEKIAQHGRKEVRQRADNSPEGKFSEHARAFSRVGTTNNSPAGEFFTRAVANNFPPGNCLTRSRHSCANGWRLYSPEGKSLSWVRNAFFPRGKPCPAARENVTYQRTPEMPEKVRMP